MRLTWLADVIRASGLAVIEDDGWETRGVEFNQPIRWICAHHTATPAAAVGDYPTLRIIRDGRVDLPGPISQLGLGRSGTVYVIASGRANHAGQGSWPGLLGGADSIGIEAEHPGGSALWNPDMYDAYVVLVAALANHLGDPVILGHKEWAQPPGRKTDPTFNMNDFRVDVAEQQEDDMPLTRDQEIAIEFAHLLRNSTLSVDSDHTFPQYLIPVMRSIGPAHKAFDARIKALDSRIVALEQGGGGSAVDLAGIKAELAELKADLRTAGS